MLRGSWYGQSPFLFYPNPNQHHDLHIRSNLDKHANPNGYTSTYNYSNPNEHLNPDRPPYTNDDLTTDVSRLRS